MPDLSAGMRSALAGRYTVDREIGSGGMAIVFRARDLRHERWVALKILRPELSATLGAERFLREIRLAAGLQHPHVLPVYDSGEAGGLLYYVMPFVEGESLRARLNREGQLPFDEALRITREVADALHYAHARDIVHRDVKPENILLGAGHALVADFGIARAISAAGGLKLTETGLAVGTPTYMSPEQAGAEQRIDGRADLYALGCVLYEMLAGEPPYQAPTSQAVMAQHSLAAIPSVRNARRSVPEVVDQAITRALAKAPADRFPTVQAFADELPLATTSMHAVLAPSRAVRAARALAAVAALVLVAVGAWVEARVWAGARHERLVLIAVAPMHYMGDTSDAYLAEGLSQELTSALTRVRGLAPRPWATVAAAAVRDGNPVDLGRQLGVDYVLASTLRRFRNQTTISAELIRVRDSTNVWSPRSFHGSPDDLLRMQDSITSQIVAELAGNLVPHDVVAATAAGQGKRDPETYRLYLQAQRVPLVSAVGSRQRIELLSRTIERDSSFADAWAALADAYASWAQYSGEPPAELLRREEAAATKAIALDSLNANAWSVLARMSHRRWDFERMDRESRRALAAAPNAANVHYDYAEHLQDLDMTDTAMAEMRRAIRLNPTNSHFLSVYAWQMQIISRYREADSLSRRALVLDSTNFVAYIMLANVALKERRFTDAVTACDDGVRVGGGDANPFMLAAAGTCYDKAGRPDKARAVLATLSEIARQRFVPRADFATIRLSLGDRNGALAELEQSAAAQEVDFLLVMHQCAQDLWLEPRYQALLRRARLDRYWTRPPRT